MTWVATCGFGRRRSIPHFCTKDAASTRPIIFFYAVRFGRKPTINISVTPQSDVIFCGSLFHESEARVLIRSNLTHRYKGAVCSDSDHPPVINLSSTGDINRHVVITGVGFDIPRASC